MASFPRIAVTDEAGAEVLRYLKLDDGQYYGGTTSDEARRLVPAAYGPHAMMTTAGLLDLLASIANQPKQPYLYWLVTGGSTRYEQEKIGREMHADKLAAILEIPEQVVRDHYANMVLIEGGGDG